MGSFIGKHLLNYHILSIKILTCSWSPKGQLVAHIQDHLQSVNKCVSNIIIQSINVLTLILIIVIVIG